MLHHLQRSTITLLIAGVVLIVLIQTDAVLLPGQMQNSIVLAKQQEQASSVTAERPTLVVTTPVCGNGFLEHGEECDDGNRRDDDGCGSTCLLEIGMCGDGVVQSLLDEQCEFSLHDISLPYACVGCRYQSTSCGDGILDAGEQCDDGPENSTSPDARCRPDCGQSRCGDGILDTTEICDDGNRRNEDGCDRYCRVEDSNTTGVTVITSDTETITMLPETVPAITFPQMLQFPQFPAYQQFSYQLPLAQLQPLIQNQGPVGDTGPAAVAVVGAGVAAGISWIRRRKK